MALDDGGTYYFNCRNSIAFVTDGANQVCLPDDGGGTGVQYPYGASIAGGTTSCGDTLTTTNFQTRNRTTSGDVRLAGGWFVSQNNGVGNLRVDLPSSGNWKIFLASGDQYSHTQTYAAIYDNTTLLSVLIDSSGGSGADQFFDATGTLYSRANWPASQTGVILTFSTTTFFLRMGKAGNTDDTWVATFGLQKQIVPSSSIAWIKA